MKGAQTESMCLPKAHIAINVRSVERSVEFYKNMFGLEPSKHHAGYAKFNVETPPLNLTLNERPFSDRGALFHLGIQVASTEEVLATRDRWNAAGLETRDEMQSICGYALQDKSWVKDPDGNDWEVFVVHKDNLGSYYSEDQACRSKTTARCATLPMLESSSSSCGSSEAK
jgi:catechol 2,3-dioxygenase-like lactoylglutathione lyase family enzyme